MRKTVISLALLALMLALSSREARSSPFCDKYAADAVKAAEEVRKLGCGERDPNDEKDGRLDLNHPQWQLNENEHKRWCLSSRPETVNAESVMRAEQLNNCRRCNDYSAHALDRAGFVRKPIADGSIDVTCGYDFNHPQWSQDRSVHLKWCMATYPTLYPSTIARERQNRDDRAGTCQTCSEYVKLAVKQTKLNSELKCGGTGPRWESTPQGHMDWCINEINRSHAPTDWFWEPKPEPSHTGDETDARAGEIARCQQRAQQGLRKGVAGAAPYTAVPRQKGKAATKPVATARRPSGSSAVDTVKPGAAKQQAPSGGSAMDRLGGGTPSSSTGSGTRQQAGPARGATTSPAPAPSTGGGTSSSGSGAASQRSGGTLILQQPPATERVR